MESTKLALIFLKSKPIQFYSRFQEKSSDGPESAGDTTGQAASSSSNQGFPEFPNKDINRRIAIISTVSALALFSSSRLDFGVSLKDLAAAALPYEEVWKFGIQ